MSLSSRRVLPWIVIAFFACASYTNAQNSNDRGTTADSKKGQSTQSTYARDKIETVNLANGNFSLAIPLATVGGRGSASFTLTLSYNSKVWSTQSDNNGVSTAEGTYGSPRNIYSAMYDKLEPEDYEPYLAKLGGGWSILTSPGIKARMFGIDPLTTGCNHFTNDQRDCGFKYALTKMWVTLPDGSQLELRDVATQGAPARTTHLDNNYHYLEDRDRGRIWRSIDGSGLIFVRDAGYPVGQIGGQNEFPSGWVFLSDGTHLRMEQGVCSKIIDRNGNFITLASGVYTDQLGRQTILNGSPVGVTVKGYMGTPDRSLTIDFGTIGDLANLRADFQSLPRPFTTGDAFRDALDNFSDHTIPTPHTDLFVKSEGSLRYGSYGLDVGTKSAVTRLNLLDGRSLRFRYNQYGEVAEIVYPGGGLSQMDYGFESSNCEIPAPFSVNRGVSARRTLTNGTDVDATWLYVEDGDWIDGVYRPAVKVEAHQGGASGTLLAKERHFFRMLNAEYRQCAGPYTGTGNEKWENAKEFRTETYTGTGTTVTVRDWQQRAAVVWANDVGLGYNTYVNEQYHTQDQPPNDPRVMSEETTLEDGKVKRVEYGYDQFNNVTSIKEFDFGAAGSPGTLLRQTVRTYGANIGANYGISINGYCYSNLDPADSSCGGGLASDVTSIIYRPGLLLNETVKDGGGTQKSYSEFEYDNYTTMANHAALAVNSGMIQYDGSRFSAFPSATQPRGNVTKITRWLGGGTDVVAYSQYDNAGEAIWSKDPNSNVSTVSYADNFGNGDSPESGVGGPNGATFALASLATNAAGQVVKMQYNYSLGSSTGVKDPNNVITKTEYDNLGRPFKVTAALGLAEQSVSEMSYPTDGVNEARVSKQLDANRWLSAKTVFDGFDRPLLAATAEDGLYYSSANYTIFSKTIYDPLGRAKLVTNPYRAVAAATDGWSRSSYDLAGRVTEMATFAGDAGNPPPDAGTNSNWTGSVTTVYASEVTTVTDQAGKQRQSVTDGLGRLKKVYEAPNDANYNYLTSYGYNTLDDLTSVSQGTQTPRSFAYDSLKRLTSATNPESGTVAYQYDANGNLTQKTDARGVVSTYQYDALNRNYSVTYTNDPANTPAVTRTYDNPTSGANGIGRLWSTQTSANTLVTIDSYDALGRPKSLGQQFYYNNTWTQPYSISSITYDRAGHVTSTTYPSGHAVTFNYDTAGRLGDKDSSHLAFTGNLGDGTTRTYSSITGTNAYDPAGHLTQEQFGTTMPIYNKLAYNTRGQLSEMRASTAGGDDSFNRGKIVNDYSDQCSGAACNGTDNNGNLKKQTVFIPNNEENTNPTSWNQQYGYDSLNRLTQVHEYTGNTSLDWQQAYNYDRWGNRTIDGNSSKTWGYEVNNAQATVSTATNRMYGPNETDANHTLVDYDFAGNQTKDYLTSNGTRTYDAENRMITATDSSYNTSTYTYDGDGRRVKRNLSGTETWQVYGLGGELIAEYAQNASPSNPQKEYGYRNGQLLVTAEPPPVNVALASNGASASASSAYQGFSAGGVINGDRKGLALGQNGVWSTAQGGFPAWLEVDFSGSKTISEIDVFTEQDNYGNPSEPNDAMTFSSYGLTGYEVQYWNGSSWADITGGNVSGNNKVWRKFSFAALTTGKIRVLSSASPDSWSRLTELEAWTGASPPPATNFALASNGATASASSAFQGFGPSGVINGDRKGLGIFQDGVWSTAQSGFPAWLEVDFNGSKTISEIDVFTEQDNYNNPSEPTEAMTFSSYGLSGYEVQSWNGSGWADVPGGSVTGNNKVWRKLTFAALTTNKIRVLSNASPDSWSRLTELEAWSAPPTPTAQIHWLVTDQLGTPRMIFDQSGSLANMSRHDYLPFGEELGAGFGLRSAGYTGDATRQKFTLKERDNETGLDFFINRYYSSMQGRFTSVDPENAGADPGRPQSWNGYAHTLNNPVTNTDPDGLKVRICGTDGQCTSGQYDLSDKEFDKYYLQTKGFSLKDGNIYQNGNLIGTFQRLSWDDLNPLGNALIFGDRTSPGLRDMAPAMKKTILIATAVSLAPVVVVVVADAAAAAAAGGGGLTLLHLGSRAVPALPAVAGALQKLSNLGISVEQANEIVESPVSQRLIDNANNGNINVIQQVGDKLIRITTDPSGQRIISAGIVRANSITNGIANGRFTPKK
jgi:RHS repeat-associated protein